MKQRMNKRPSIGLIVALMMFPQIIETIYSPALPNLAQAFMVSKNVAAQTLSIYFIAFALGVVVWGRLSDIAGRRNTMLCGLAIYGLGSTTAIFAPDFSVIFIARIMSAFGAAVGSVVTQTMLRDRYEGSELGQVFSIMGMGISISPVIGLMAGGFLVEHSGYLAVFTLLLVLALILLLVSFIWLPETKPQSVQQVSLWSVLSLMVKDNNVIRSAVLIAMFNVMMFSYYSIGPFIFTELGHSSEIFGYSGFVLAISSVLGSMMNRRLLAQGYAAERLVRFAVGLSLLSAVGVWMTQHSLLFLLPMVGIVISFGVAIPNILSYALVDYKANAGTAGALFGLMYYMILGVSLSFTGWGNNLGVALIVSAIICVIALLSNKCSKRSN